MPLNSTDKENEAEMVTAWPRSCSKLEYEPRSLWLQSPKSYLQESVTIPIILLNLSWWFMICCWDHLLFRGSMGWSQTLGGCGPWSNHGRLPGGGGLCIKAGKMVRLVGLCSRKGVGETEFREHSKGPAPGLTSELRWGFWESLMWEDNAET